MSGRARGKASRNGVGAGFDSPGAPGELSESRGVVVIAFLNDVQERAQAVPEELNEVACGAVQARPFARLHFDELRAAVDFAVARHCPGRGEHVGEL